MQKSNSKKIISIITTLLIVFSVFALSGCGGGENADEHKKDDKAAKKKRAPRKRRATKKKSKPKSSSGGTKTRSKKSKRKGPVKVDNLVIRNPERIEALLKAKEYGYSSKYNIFRDYVVRERERIDTDKDGIPDIYDPDDDNDRFPDVQEIAEGFDPLNKYSHPVSNTLGGDAGVINQPVAAAEEPDSKGKKGKKSKSRKKGGKKGSSSSVNQPIVETQTAGVYFRGLFGIRNNKVAVLKVVKDKKDNIILRREGEKFAGIKKGSEYLLEEINLVKEFIKVRDLEKDNLIKLSFQKDKKDKKTVQAADASAGSAKKKGKKPSSKPKKKKTSTKKKK